MKNFTLLLTFSLLFSPSQSFAQYQLNNEAFVSKSKELFEIAKKRFPGETKSQKLDAGEGYKLAFATEKRYEEAYSTRIVIDNDDLTGLESRFLIGKNKDEAMKVMMQMVELLKTSQPAKYTNRNTYEVGFVDGNVYIFEYDSEIFAQQAKQSSARIGIREVNGEFLVELTFFEPIFKI